VCAKLQVSLVSGSWYYYLLSAAHQKCNFPKWNYQSKLNEQSAKQLRSQMVFRMSTVSIHTLSHSRVRYW